MSEQIISGNPSVRLDMPEQAYHAVDACSHSRLVRLRDTPAHCRWAIDHPAESESMTLGSITDCLVMGAQITDSFVVAPEINRRTSEGKAQWAAIQADAAASKRKIITTEQLHQGMAMAEAVMAHGVARKLVESALKQVSVFWRERDLADCSCKARIDLALWDIGCNFDLKTTRDAGDHEFSRSIAAFGYHLQAAMYEIAASVAGRGVDRFGFVLVTNNEPYLARVVELDRGAIDRGHRELARLMPIYAECVRTGEWPGYPEPITTLSLPAWAERLEP